MRFFPGRVFLLVASALLALSCLPAGHAASAPGKGVEGEDAPVAMPLTGGPSSATAAASLAERTSQLDAAFDAIDKDHDGSISRQEFRLLSVHELLRVLADLKSLEAVAAAANGFSLATVNSITMTIATELGDKTFCIAAVMAMRYNRAFVFSGGIGALIVMTILSVGIGVAVPALLPKVYTHYAAAILFAYFGVKLLAESRKMKGDEAGELEEAEEELGFSGEAGKGEDSAAAGGEGGAIAPHSSAGTAALEAGLSSSSAGSRGADVDPAGKSSASKVKAMGFSASSLPLSLAGLTAFFSLHLSADWPIFTQAFSITFLAEWGDRSQIATIAMAAQQNPYGVCLGAIIGHSLCTGLAVIGGRMLASRISEKTVALVGGILFLVFALHSIIGGADVDE